MSLGIIMGAMQGAGEAGQQIAQQNNKLWDTQALAQQQSDLDTAKQASLINLQNQNAVNMLAEQNAARDADREQAARRIQAAATPALQAATIAKAQADPEYDWVPADTVLNAAGVAPAGTKTIAPSLYDLSPSDLQRYAPTAGARAGIIANAALATGDIGAQGALQEYMQDQATQRAEALQQAQFGQSAMLQQNQFAQSDKAQAAQIAAQAALYGNRGGAGQLAARNGYALSSSAPEIPFAALALPMPATQAELVTGRVYRTARGAAAWNGSAFTPVQGQ
ncbi:MAG: hypothetical protein ACHP7O_01040 [Burkholderiales bacterium]